jgi:hypothetical protein
MFGNNNYHHQINTVIASAWVSPPQFTTLTSPNIIAKYLTSFGTTNLRSFSFVVGSMADLLIILFCN